MVVTEDALSQILVVEVKEGKESEEVHIAQRIGRTIMMKKKTM